MFPCVQLAVGAGLPEQGVALLECARVATPERQEIAAGIATFHVEQPPIDVTAPHFAAAVNQGVAAGLEGDDCQCLAQFTEVAHRATQALASR
mgnify:CR=1 FL=1